MGLTPFQTGDWLLTSGLRSTRRVRRPIPRFCAQGLQFLAARAQRKSQPYSAVMARVCGESSPLSKYVPAGAAHSVALGRPVAAPEVGPLAAYDRCGWPRPRPLSHGLAIHLQTENGSFDKLDLTLDGVFISTGESPTWGHVTAYGPITDKNSYAFIRDATTGGIRI